MVLALGSSGVVSAYPKSDIPYGVVDVDGAEIPIVGEFVYSKFRQPADPEVRGLIHGLRRVEGATVLYYSAGFDTKYDDSFSGRALSGDQIPGYHLDMAADITIFDLPANTGYSPLKTADKTFTTKRSDMEGPAGKLYVGWALFPELPKSTTTVTLMMPWGTAVGDIPVEEGALSPVSEEPAPELSKGWPKVPAKAEYAQADLEYSTWELLKRSSDVERVAQVQESTEDVLVTLDAGVLFAKESADLSPEATKTLATVAEDIKERGTGEVMITGHTDSDGPDDENQILSEQRAAAVQAALEPKAGPNVTLVSAGRGEAEPVASNGTPEGQQQNRRVTVHYTVKEGK